MPAAEDAKAECYPTSTNGRGWVTRSGRRLQTPATERKAAPRRSAEARGAFSTAAGRRERLRARGQREAEHPRAGKGHSERVGGKPPAAVGGCCGRAVALSALRRVEDAHESSDTDGKRLPSVWAKSARMLTRPIDAAALARCPKREKVAASRTRRGDHVRCARGQGGKVAARPQQGGGHGFGAGGCGRQNTPEQARGIPNGQGGKPPAAVGGGRWLGGCRGCVVPRRPTMSAAGLRARPRGWGHAGRQMWGALQGQGGGAGHHKAIICKSYVKLLAIYEA